MPHLRIEAGGSEDYRGMLVLISLPLTISLSTCHVLQSTHSVPTRIFNKTLWSRASLQEVAPIVPYQQQCSRPAVEGWNFVSRAVG